MGAPQILVVDDEPSVRLTIASLLEIEGFEVLTADCGAKGLELVHQNHLDIVLSDIRMPGMSGVQLFRAIREASPATRVILMTAFADELLIEDALANGIYTIIPKPVEMDRLLEILKRAIQRPNVLVISPAPEESMSAFQRAGIPALSGRTARDALAILGDENVDVCVIDLSLVDMPGPQLIQQIRNAPSGARCLGLCEDSSNILDVLAAGAVACLRVPVEPGKLLRFIANIRGALRRDR